MNLNNVQTGVVGSVIPCHIGSYMDMKTIGKVLPPPIHIKILHNSANRVEAQSTYKQIAYDYRYSNKLQIIFSL